MEVICHINSEATIKMPFFADNSYKYIFCHEKVWSLIQISRNSVFKGPNGNKSLLERLGIREASMHYRSQYMARFTDAYMRH